MRHWLIAFALFGALGTPAALADLREHDAQAVDWSFRRGELVVLDFHVKRCPVCHGKSPALEQVIAKDLRAGRVQAFLVDFDEDTKLVRKYGVKYRNTALFLHKGVEVARVGGDFAHEKLAQALHDGFDAAFKKIDRK